jgi:hypothetical protein
MKTKDMCFKDLQIGDKFIYEKDFICIKVPPCYRLTKDMQDLPLCNAFCIECSVKYKTKKESDQIRSFFKNQFLKFVDEQAMKKIIG